MTELHVTARRKIHEGKLEEFKKLAVSCLHSVQEKASRSQRKRRKTEEMMRKSLSQKFKKEVAFVFDVRGVVVLAALATLFLSAQLHAAGGSLIPAERDSVYRQLLDFGSKIKDASLEPHWMADMRSFWYVENAPANTVIIKIDPANNSSEPLFDTDRLRAALEPVLGHKPPYAGLPFENFRFLDDEKAICFDLEKQTFRMDRESYEITRVGAAEEPQAATPQARLRENEELPAPVGPWTAVAKDYNIWLKSSEDGRLVPLTENGVERFSWTLGSNFWGRSALWSPNGTRLLAFRTDLRQVHHTPVIHWLKTNHEEITWSPYAATGEQVPQFESYIFDVTSRVATTLDLGADEDPIISPIYWRPDGSEILILRLDRLMKQLDMLAVNTKTGEARTVLTEKQATFIEGLAYNPSNLFVPFSDGSRFVWRSERDGWSHLYLYDSEGTLLSRLTGGEAPVDKVVTIDEEGEWVYYLARDDRDRPYDVHVHRVDLKGKRASRLTEAPGVHSPAFAPGKAFFLDTHSSVDRPPTVELRRADGSQLRVIRKADISVLENLGWRPPEEFRVKAADGKSDLYGALYKPYDFDPSKRYPVIDLQYMGNFRHSAPRTFSGYWLGDNAQALTQLGFIVYIVDARGTTGRGKAFQDFTYNNIGRIEVPDHVATLRELAATRPYMDTTRVGITGFSWGGYFTIRALLTAPDVFDVGISGAPVVDLRAATSPIEPYMGLPQDNPEAYEQGSNLLLADRLEGKLLIVIGTSDVNVTFNHTMRMANAFIKAKKFFDLIVMPEETHYLTPAGSAYYREARDLYFVEHLRPYESYPVLSDSGTN